MIPQTLTLTSPAKINLYLAVGKKINGFHTLRSIITAIDLQDTLSFQKNTLEISDRCIIQGTHKIPVEDNLILQAVKKYFSHAYWKRKKREFLHIQVQKKIPIGGGLGGGSSNAAITLLALQHLFPAPIPARQIHQMAASLGSDVPFFLHGGLAKVYGRGEKIKPLPDLPRTSFLLIETGLHCDTKKVYGAYDFQKSKSRRIPPLSLLYQNQKKWLEKSFNQLEAPAFQTYPHLKEFQKEFLRQGIQFLMSGSGSSFFIFNPFQKLNFSHCGLKKKVKAFKVHTLPCWTLKSLIRKKKK